MKRRENEITDDDLKRESEAMRKKQREEIKKDGDDFKKSTLQGIES